MTVVYAAGLLALVLGGLNLWLSREAVDDSFHMGEFSYSLGALLSCVAMRWTWAKADRAFLRRRSSVIAFFGIVAALILLLVFRLWLTFENIA